MAKKITIGVVFGGRSAEHEVSLVSAASVMSALDKNKYDIVPIGITKRGKWLAGPEALMFLKKGTDTDDCHVALPPDPTLKQLIAAACRDTAVRDMLKPLDVVFPVLHGTFGEDGTVQGLLELAGIPYVGAGVLGSSLSMDKVLQKMICRQAGLPVVDFLWFRRIDWKNGSENQAPILLNQLSNVTQSQMLDIIEEKLGFALFVKPANLGSSVGISKVVRKEDLGRAIELAFKYDHKILLEKAVPNAREIEVSILGNEVPRASIAGEIKPSNEFYDYDAKYVDGASELFIPAKLPEDIHEAIQMTAIKAAMAVNVEGMARVDMLMDGQTNHFYLNELNTIPGFTQISMYPKLWEASGLPYPALLDELVRLALARQQRTDTLWTSFQPKQDWYK